MSLDFSLHEVQEVEVFDANITHNLAGMAEAAGIYKHLWRPEELGISRAAELIVPLAAGLALLEAEPERFRKFDAENGWGKYENFVPFVRDCLKACIDHPNATVSASR